ncbi:MAG: hypothetical protein CM15mP32_3720 [Flavobacteriaceae bacterium]|nr:MAG: hypothetical protein CM15mP32_3720 [Flavobacteriaceae bacterium]
MQEIWGAVAAFQQLTKFGAKTHEEQKEKQAKSLKKSVRVFTNRKWFAL